MGFHVNLGEGIGSIILSNLEVQVYVDYIENPNLGPALGENPPTCRLVSIARVLIMVL